MEKIAIQESWGKSVHEQVFLRKHEYMIDMPLDICKSRHRRSACAATKVAGGGDCSLHADNGYFLEGNDRSTGKSPSIDRSGIKLFLINRHDGFSITDPGID
jgi:hypothetical protein